MSEEVPVESITLEQFAQSLLDQEVHGMPVGVTYVALKREPVPGQELLRHRVRVSFEFDVTCNTSPILSSRNDSDVQGHDMALLKSFLVADKAKLLDLMVDKIGNRLTWHPDAFMDEFLSQVNVGAHELFRPAIDALEGDEGEYWRDISDATIPNEGDLLSLCTEQVTECFNAEFVSSSYEIVKAH